MGVLADRPVFIPAALLAALAALVVGALLQRPAPPHGLAVNGLIAYSEGGDIHARHPVSGEVRLLVGGPETDVGPSFSPDGTRLAFGRITRQEPRTMAVMVADADGSNVRTVVDPEPVRGAHGLAWSPESDMLAITNIGPGIPALSVVNVRGTPQRREIRVPIGITDVEWRPGTDELILGGSSGTGRYGFFAVRSDGTGFRELEPSPATNSYNNDFSVSLDGRYLAYASRDDTGLANTHVRDFDSGETRSLGGWQFRQYDATFSPDGARLAFVRSRGITTDGQSQAFIGSVRGDGTDVVAIGPEVPPRPGVRGSRLRVLFSPDGTQLLIVELATDMSVGLPVVYEAWLADVSTGDYHAVAVGDDQSITWQRR